MTAVDRAGRGELRRPRWRRAGRPTSPAVRPDADFTAEVTVADSAVRDDLLRFTNRSNEEMLLPDQLADENGEYDGSTSRAYVTGEDGAVLISQRVFPQPDTDRKDWAQAPKVQGTRVPAGETVAARSRSLGRSNGCSPSGMTWATA